MTRAKTHVPKNDKKTKLEPLGEDDLDAAFAGIRLETPSPAEPDDVSSDARDAAEAKDAAEADAAIDALGGFDGGSDFSSAHTGLPEVKQAAVSKRRAATNADVIDPLPASAATRAPVASAGPAGPAGPVGPRRSGATLPPPVPGAVGRQSGSVAAILPSAARSKGATVPPAIQISVPARITPLPARLATPVPAEDLIEEIEEVDEASIAEELPAGPRTLESGDEWDKMRAVADERAAVKREASPTPAPPAKADHVPAGVKALAKAKAAVAGTPIKPAPVASAPAPAAPASPAPIVETAPPVRAPIVETAPPVRAPIVETAPPVRAPVAARAASSADVDIDIDVELDDMLSTDAPSTTISAAPYLPARASQPIPLAAADPAALDAVAAHDAAAALAAIAELDASGVRATDIAAREEAAAQEVALINQAAVAREEAAARVKAVREAAAAKELAKAAKQAAHDEQVRATAEARAQAQARAAALSGGGSARPRAPEVTGPQPRLADPVEPMTDSQRALERALRDSEPKLPRPEAVPDDVLDHALRESVSDLGKHAYPRADSDDFSLPGVPMPQAPRGPLPRVDLGRTREVSVSDSQLLEVGLDAPSPLQVAVFETAPDLQAASLAVAGAGHAMAVGASGREGLLKIQRALVDGQLDAVIIGMPGGEQLIQAALSMTPRAPVVIAACSGKATDAVREATSTGADLVAIRPHDADRLAPVLLAAARLAQQRHDVATAQHNEADLLARLEAGEGVDDADVGGLQPYEHFQRALELELKRVRRYQYALSIALFALEVPDPSPPGIRGILRARASNALIHSIRDIDMATLLDEDRFLVLLPYTDVQGATEVARRIITAVDAIPAVVAMGSSFQVQLTGAIAGAKPGTQLSFGKLIKDANRALAAARRDGAELAVQP